MSAGDGSSPPLALWLIEGVPGSGKTTAAREVCARAVAAGRAARWWLEEDAAHPVTPAALRRRASEPGFSALSVAAIGDFVARERGVAILEGCALQSTARFLFANGWPAARIGEHFARWQAAAAPAAPRLLLLRVADVAGHFEGFVARARGPAWTAKVAGYVERTPLGAANGWRGVDGLARFWGGYQDLILGLAEDFRGPVRVVEADPAGAAFDAAGALGFFGGVDGGEEALSVTFGDTSP